MSDVSYAESRRIKFTRTTRRDEHYGTQINTATCSMCGTELWTQGHIDGVTGVGELNRRRRQPSATALPPRKDTEVSVISPFLTPDEFLVFRLQELPSLCGPIPELIIGLINELIDASPENKALALDVLRCSV